MIYDNQILVVVLSWSLVPALLAVVPVKLNGACLEYFPTSIFLLTLVEVNHLVCNLLLPLGQTEWSFFLTDITGGCGSDCCVLTTSRKYAFWGRVMAVDRIDCPVY